MASACRIIARLRRLFVLLVAGTFLFAIWIAAFGKLLQPLMTPHWCGWPTATPAAPSGTVELWLQEWGLPLIAVGFVVTLATALIVLRRRGGNIPSVTGCHE